MKSARRTPLVTLALALSTLAVGCGGSASWGSKSASSAPYAPEADASPAGAAPGAPAPMQEAPSATTLERSGSERRAETAPEPRERPGLATEWGETRMSRITTVPFVRAEADSPFASTSLFYNDAHGARAMSNVAGFRRFN